MIDEADPIDYARIEELRAQLKNLDEVVYWAVHAAVYMLIFWFVFESIAATKRSMATAHK